MRWKSAWQTRSYSLRSPYSYNPRLRRSKLWARLAFLSFIVVLGLFLLLTVIFPIFAFSLPSPDRIVRQEGFSTKIYDRNGELIYDIFAEQKRTPVALSSVPVFLRQATIAIEDKNFYKHQGFDPFGVFRAVYNIVVHRRLQGGSTLTQQLVKNVLLTPERTLLRKIREFILAVQIERKYTKDQILQMYLNEAPYGGTAWGVEAAAEVYLGKKVQDLSLVESAILAGFPQRPSFYSPFGSNPKAYIGRAEQVLRRMREDGYITREQEQEAASQLPEAKFMEKGASLLAPHFVTYVQQILEERYGERLVEQGGLRVTTALDLELQKKAQEAVSEEIKKVESLNVTNGAAVVLDVKTGEILSMVGSKNWAAQDYEGKFNVATQALRQPGSAIKPVTYATALKKGFTAASVIADIPTTFPGGAGQPDYKPVNYDGKFRGPMQLRFALGNSINMVAVKLLSLVGIRDMLSTAYDLGITTLEPSKENLERVGLSLTLGGGEVRLLEITGAYAVFANGGLRVDPVAILKVTDKDGKILEEVKPKPAKRVLTAEQAFIISHILSDNLARLEIFGPRSALFVQDRNLAVKTGTTNDKRDNWTIGWSPDQVVVGAWVGNNDFSPMIEVASGVTGAAPIWKRIILEALSGKPVTSFTVPAGIVTAAVDIVSGYAAHDGFPSRIEYFIKGTEPAGPDSIHVKLKVCKNEGKLATPSQIAAGDFEEKEFFVIAEEDPTGPPNRWQEGINTWLATQPDPKYHPPTEYCGGGGTPVNVDFITPKDRQQLDLNTFEVRIDARSTVDIVQVEIELDGVKLATIISYPWKAEISTSDGPHELRAKARDENGNESDRRIKIGVNVPWDWSPTPTPTPTP